jgi:membrane-bound lytic murein transglycosylase D
MNRLTLSFLVVSTLFLGCAHREQNGLVNNAEILRKPLTTETFVSLEPLKKETLKLLCESAENISENAQDCSPDEMFEDDHAGQSAYRLNIPETNHVKNCKNYFLKRFRRDYVEGLERRRNYIHMIRRLTAQRNMPKAVKWIPMVESWFQCDARSEAQAAGLWQLMPATAKAFGLRIDEWVDERNDPEKSTIAALDYLEYLYGRIGCWFLSLAAYHSGEGTVYRAIRNKGTDDYWELAKNREFSSYTRFYVAAIMALTLIERYRDEYAVVFPKEEPLEYSTVQLEKPLDLRHLSDQIGVTLDVLKQLNPSLKRNVTPPDYPGFVLKVPVEQRDNTVEFLAEYTFGDRSNHFEYTIQSGDTLIALAKRYKTSIESLMTLNRLNCHLIIAGRKLLIPEY